MATATAPIVSEEIRPMAHIHRGPRQAPPATWKFEDNTTCIYPKLPGGGSCKVVIIRHKLTCSDGAVFHVCRNAGKWSYRIQYPFQQKDTRMPVEKFLLELTRMGGRQFAEAMLAKE